jgi:small subunit ribosomal protein S2
MPIVTLQELLEAGVHFGHQTQRWHPNMRPYIYGERNGIYIIDLRETLKKLYEAYERVVEEVTRGGIVLFVGTKNQAQDIVRQEAERCGMYYVNHRWLGGTLTNWKTVQSSIRELQRLEELERSGKIDQYGKKEGIKLRKRLEKLNTALSGIKNMPRVPDVMFVIDAKHEHIAVAEAKRLNILCIGIVDTNCDPSVVSLPIPGNDDAIRAIQLYCRVISQAVLEGRLRADKVRSEYPEFGRGRGSKAVKPEAAPALVTESADEVEVHDTDYDEAEVE